jgi:hypothetical protein
VTSCPGHLAVLRVQSQPDILCSCHIDLQKGPKLALLARARSSQVCMVTMW